MRQHMWILRVCLCMCVHPCTRVGSCTTAYGVYVRPREKQWKEPGLSHGKTGERAGCVWWKKKKISKCSD